MNIKDMSMSIWYSPTHFIEHHTEVFTLEGFDGLPQWGQHGSDEVLLCCQVISLVRLERDHIGALSLCEGNSDLLVAVRGWVWSNMQLQSKPCMDKIAQLELLSSVTLDPTGDPYVQFFKVKTLRTLIEAFELQQDPHWGKVSFESMVSLAGIEQEWKHAQWSHTGD